MAYTAGDTILATEYNTFVNSSTSPYGYNHIAGTGSGEYGLGQAEIATVSGGSSTITAAQWNSLLTGIDNIANHTNDTVTSRTQVSAGDTIAIKAAVATDLATLASSVAGGSTSATALTTSSALQTVTTASEGWDTSATQEVSATFASANAMRHFFNAGGKLRVTVGITAASTSNKDTAFSDLGTAIGNLDIGSLATTRSGSGETETTNGLANGFRDLSTAYTSLLKLTSDNGGYTSNDLEISAKLDAAVGTAVTLTIKQFAQDPADDTTYTVPNTSGVPGDPNKAPQMTLTLTEFYPNASEGLSGAHNVSSNAEVSNSAS